MSPVSTAAYYCGAAPNPENLVWAWNFDLVAIALCACLAIFHFQRFQAERRKPLLLALITMLLLYVTPFCALTVALFSARVAHHVILVAVVAPFLALAFPEQRGGRTHLPLEWLVGLHALLIWGWHAPQAYSIGIESGLPYWTMQLTLLGSGMLMWRRILSPRTETGAAMFALLANIVQMGMLGALLTFAQQPLYTPHFTTTLPFGLTPIDDQQLAGLIMWVPAAVPYLLAAVFLFAARLDHEAGSASR
jgi:putative membrane protein